MRAPTVSIIIPCYNHARFLSRAIDSVLGQTFSDWEVIVVDDGSTDNTHEVATQFADQRVRYVHQENQGLSAARNTGILAAKGEYLAFLDADDEWECRFLERCVTTLDSNPKVAGVYTFNYHIDEEGRRLPRQAGEIVPSEELYERLLQGGFFPPCAVLVRTVIVQRLGLFDTGLQGQGAEDWDLWLRMSHRFRMRGIPEVLARYRVYPGSMSTNTAKMHACRISVLVKNIGPPDEIASCWSTKKRSVYAFAFRHTALDYLLQREYDKGWDILLHAVEISPSIITRLDTFYELALGDQPRGYRGDARLVDINANGTEMLQRLDDLFVLASPLVQVQKSSAYGNAYLALAMLSDQAGDWQAARRYLRNALWAHPALGRDKSVVRRSVKLLLGQRAAHGLTGLRVDNVGRLEN